MSSALSGRHFDAGATWMDIGKLFVAGEVSTTNVLFPNTYLFNVAVITMPYLLTTSVVQV